MSSEKEDEVSKNKKLLIGFLALLLFAMPLLGACGEKEVVKEVVKEVPVEKEVVKEVVKEVPVEKVVEKEVVKEVEVEKVVEKEVIKEVEKGTIKIAASLDLSGPYATAQRDIHYGMMAFTKWLNDTKGGIKGHRVEYLIRDMAYDQSRDLANYKELRDLGVVGMLEGIAIFSAALKPQLERDKQMVVVCSPTKPVVDPPGRVFGCFSPYVEDSLMIAEPFLEMWKEDRPPKAGFVSMDNPAGRMVANDDAKEWLISKGFEFTSMELVPVVPTDTTPQLLRLKEAGTDIAFGGFVPATGKVLLSDRDRIGWEGVLAAMWPAGLATSAGMLPADVTHNALWAGQGWALPEMNTEGTQRVEKAIHDAGLKPIDNNYCFSGWMAAALLAKGIELALEEVPFDELLNDAVYEHGMYKIKDYDCEGVTRGLTFEKPYVNGINYGTVGRIIDGQVEALGWYPLPFIEGQSFRKPPE